jgi:dual specificity tyrosine-phosphorylation-regulated kinase 1
LEYLAHPSINVIHCDLKPENILLVHPKHSNIKIIDFGSSCLSQKQLYQYIQSRFYRSPEVLLGKKYTCAIDMWSLGCIMVEMHTGEPLFGGADQHDQLRRITNVLGMPPRELIEQANPTFRRQYFDEIVMVEGDNRLTDYRMKVRKNSTNNSQIIEENGLRSLRDIIGVDSGGPQGRRLGDTAHSAHHYHLFLDLVQRMLDYK